MKLQIRTLLILLFIALIFSCSKEESTPAVDLQSGNGAPESLTIGLMPAVDTAPIFLAKDKGYYAEENLSLEIILFTNAQDRQSALQSGEIDGAMTDLVALTVNRAGGFPVKATTLTDGMFPIIMRPDAEKKKRVKIGLMEISVSNFLVDEWLSDDYELEKVFINAIPARLEAVISGNLDMGLFPEPIASVGALNGLKKVIYSPVDGYTPDIMVFTESALKKTKALTAFHKAFNKAVSDIRLNEEEARDSLLKNIPNLKPELKKLIELPEYNEARLPDKAFLEKIISWTDTITSQPITVSPAELIDDRFLNP